MNLIRERHKEKKLMLFVGAGVSMALGLPSWRQLIDHIAGELGYDPDIFRTYGSDMALAEYYRIKKKNISALRSWMDREWHASSIDISKSRVHELIATSGFDLIYTTNYDRWIERAFERYGVEFAKVASASDLANHDQSKALIVKFHGDFDSPDESIVLDESSYFKRLEFESPLDIRLRSDLLSRSVLFIGYSVSDINIRLMFHRLAKVWEAEGLSAEQPACFFYSHRPNEIQASVLRQWGIQMVAGTSDDPTVSLVELLEAIR